MAQPTNLIVKVLDNLSNVYVFSTPKQHSGSLQDILKYGSFLACKARDGECYVDLTGIVLDSSETNQFNMVKLFKLDTGRDKEAFFSYARKIKIIVPEVVYSKSFVTAPKVKSTPHNLEKVAQALKIDSAPPVVAPVVTKVEVPVKPAPKVEKPIPPAELPKQQELRTEWLGLRIDGLRELAKDPLQKVLFESFVARSRTFPKQSASNLIIYVKKHHGVEVTKKTVMRFFMEQQRLGFGKYVGGPKNKKGWVSPTTMTFTWVHCTAEAVAKCALGLDYPVPLFSKYPTRFMPLPPTGSGAPVAKAIAVKNPEETGAESKLDEVLYYCIDCENGDEVFDVKVIDSVTKIEYSCTNPKCKNAVPTVLSGVFTSIPDWVGEYDTEDVGDDEDEPALATAAQALLNNMKEVPLVLSGKMKEIPIEPPTTQIVGPFATAAIAAPVELSPNREEKIDQIRNWLMDLTDSGAKGDTQLAWLTFNKMISAMK